MDHCKERTAEKSHNASRHQTNDHEPCAPLFPVRLLNSLLHHHGLPLFGTGEHTSNIGLSRCCKVVPLLHALLRLFHAGHGESGPLLVGLLVLAEHLPFVLEPLLVLLCLALAPLDCSILPLLLLVSLVFNGPRGHCLPTPLAFDPSLLLLLTALLELEEQLRGKHLMLPAKLVPEGLL